MRIERFNIPELQTYVNGIRFDIKAVKNGIKMKYNNGLAEGSVNKIKVIKRTMYGRTLERTYGAFTLHLIYIYD